MTIIIIYFFIILLLRVIVLFRFMMLNRRQNSRREKHSPERKKQNVWSRLGNRSNMTFTVKNDDGQRHREKHTRLDNVILCQLSSAISGSAIQVLNFSNELNYKSCTCDSSYLHQITDAISFDYKTRHKKRFFGSHRLDQSLYK